jgi:hypothetical protein
MQQFLSDQQLNDREERYKSLRKLLMIDIDALIKEVWAYKKLTSELQAGQKAHKAEANQTNIWDHLPDVLRPVDIQEILQVSKNKAYSFLRDPPFQVKR